MEDMSRKEQRAFGARKGNVLWFSQQQYPTIGEHSGRIVSSMIGQASISMQQRERSFPPPRTMSFIMRLGL